MYMNIFFFLSLVFCHVCLDRKLLEARYCTILGVCIIFGVQHHGIQSNLGLQNKFHYIQVRDFVAVVF